jgi:hypothetical protein
MGMGMGMFRPLLNDACRAVSRTRIAVLPDKYDPEVTRHYLVFESAQSG